eukprot:gene28016-31116_t
MEPEDKPPNSSDAQEQSYFFEQSPPGSPDSTSSSQRGASRPPTPLGPSFAAARGQSLPQSVQASPKVDMSSSPEARTMAAAGADMGELESVFEGLGSMFKRASSATDAQQPSLTSKISNPLPLRMAVPRPRSHSTANSSMGSAPSSSQPTGRAPQGTGPAGLKSSSKPEYGLMGTAHLDPPIRSPPPPVLNVLLEASRGLAGVAPSASAPTEASGTSEGTAGPSQLLTVHEDHSPAATDAGPPPREQAASPTLSLTYEGPTSPRSETTSEAPSESGSTSTCTTPVQPVPPLFVTGLRASQPAAFRGPTTNNSSTTTLNPSPAAYAPVGDSGGSGPGAGSMHASLDSRSWAQMAGGGASKRALTPIEGLEPADHMLMLLEASRSSRTLMAQRTFAQEEKLNHFNITREDSIRALSAAFSGSETLTRGHTPELDEELRRSYFCAPAPGTPEAEAARQLTLVRPPLPRFEAAALMKEARALQQGSLIHSVHGFSGSRPIKSGHKVDTRQYVKYALNEEMPQLQQCYVPKEPHPATHMRAKGSAIDDEAQSPKSRQDNEEDGTSGSPRRTTSVAEPSVEQLRPTSQARVLTNGIPLYRLEQLREVQEGTMRRNKEQTARQ